MTVVDTENSTIIATGEIGEKGSGKPFYFDFNVSKYEKKEGMLRLEIDVFFEGDPGRFKRHYTFYHQSLVK